MRGTAANPVNRSGYPSMLSARGLAFPIPSLVHVGWLQEGGTSVGKGVFPSPRQCLESDSPEGFQPPTFSAVGWISSSRGEGAGLDAIYHSDLL